MRERIQSLRIRSSAHAQFLLDRSRLLENKRQRPGSNPRPLSMTRAMIDALTNSATTAGFK